MATIFVYNNLVLNQYFFVLFSFPLQRSRWLLLFLYESILGEERGTLVFKYLHLSKFIRCLGDFSKLVNAILLMQPKMLKVFQYRNFHYSRKINEWKWMKNPPCVWWKLLIPLLCSTSGILPISSNTCNICS